MTLQRIVLLMITTLLISACKVTSSVQIPIAEYKVSEDLRSERVLIEFDKSFAGLMHDESNFVAVYTYEIGKYLQFAIKDSLESRFANVYVTEDLESDGEYDIRIVPKLISFEAPVPIQVYLKTKAKIEIEYAVTPKPPLSPYTIVASGDYDFDSEDDKLFYEAIQTQDKSFYYYDMYSGLGMNIPDYAFVAGKDTVMAVREALNKLSDKLVEELDKKDAIE